MKPFFKNAEACEALIAALEKRRGLPFRYNIGSESGGYDCWHLVYDVYREAGLDLASMQTFPRGSLNWGRIHKDSRILSYLLNDELCRRHLRRLEPDSTLITGDLLAIRQGRSCNHLAIVQDALTGWHVPRGGDVSTFAIKQFQNEDAIHCVFRINMP